MAKIQVAQGKEWTASLTNILASAGHEVTAQSSDRAPDLAFIDGSESSISLGEAPAIVVAGGDRLGQAIALVKGGAYAFVRYPFISDEVTLLVDRALDHLSLSAEHSHASDRMESATPVNGDAMAAARNLAGQPLADIEKQVILSTLEVFKGHRVKTATALGIGVRTLGMKIKRWRDEGEPIIGRNTGRPMQVR